MRSSMSFALTALALLVGATVPAHAEDFYVTTLVDSYDWTCDAHCSLRDAIQEANADLQTVDTIYLQEGTYELTTPGIGELYAATGDLDLRTSMNIVGKGPLRTVIDANGLDRVFNMAWGGIDILIRGVTITGGWVGALHSPPAGSAISIFASSSNVTLETCILEENHSAVSTAIYGGGIYLYHGNLTVRHSMIRNNSAGQGGAIYITGGGSSNVTIERSTIYGNTSFLGLGNIANNSGIVNINNSTVGPNSASTGDGGVYNSYGTVSLMASTVSGNTGADIVAKTGGGGQVVLERTIIDGHCSADAAGDINSNWFNLESPGNTCQLLTVQDKFDVPDALIDDLNSNGGPTPTMHPQAASPAVDPSFFLVSISCNGEKDQRGMSRPRGFGFDPDCDIGAVERVPGSIFNDNFECGFFTAWSSASP